MPYVFETHLHTCQGSACGVAHGREYIEYMKKQGFDGIIVTDHFFNGNCAVPKDLPWKERVDMYMSGYEEALAESGGKDFTVLFGIEFNFQGDEYLIYGPGREWLLEQDTILEADRQEVYRRVHEGGGIMVQAHPYRERGYLSAIHLTPSICDGIEVYNAANKPNMNALAYEYAEKLKLPMTAGSDIHFMYDGDKGAMLLEDKPETTRDFADMLLAGKTKCVVVRECVPIPLEEVEEQLKIEHGPELPVIEH